MTSKRPEISRCSPNDWSQECDAGVVSLELKIVGFAQQPTLQCVRPWVRDWIDCQPDFPINSAIYIRGLSLERH
jgi:hypothetical protein